jgi:sugar phosphate isomerase/epimerase
MRITIAAGAMTFYPVKSTLAISRDAGFDAVELLLTPTMLRRGAERYQSLAEEMMTDIASVHARLHYRDVGLAEKIESDRQSIRFAARLDTCDCVVLHPPTSRTGDLGDIRRWLDALCDEREALGSTLGLAIENRPENHDGTIRQQLDNLDRLRIVAGEWDVDVTLDIAHAASFGIDPIVAIDAVAPRLRNIHLSDARATHYRGGIMNGLFRDHQVPGSGSIDIRAVSDRLRHHGYTGLVTLELSPVSLRAYWPWAPARILSAAHRYLVRNGLSDELDASAGASSQRQMR